MAQQEVDDELLAVEEIYGQDFKRLSSRECTVRLPEPWNSVVLRFVLPDAYPDSAAVVFLCESRSLSADVGDALGEFVQQTAGEQSSQAAIFTLVTEATEYLSSLPADCAAAKPSPTQSEAKVAPALDKVSTDHDGASASQPAAATAVDPPTSQAALADNQPAPAVCRFYKKGSCRFGDGCHNIHPGARKTKPPAAPATDPAPTGSEATTEQTGPAAADSKTSSSGSRSAASSNTNSGEGGNSGNTSSGGVTGGAGGGKKPPMRQVVDVIHRIQWDDSLPTQHFSIGYLDRFIGIIEKPFAAFSWEDLASVDSRTVLAVPKHRFQYIKLRDEIVWDKRVQLDNFFGSRGDGTTIAEVVERHAEAAKASAKSRPAADDTAAPAATESQPGLAFEEDDDGDEETGEGGAAAGQRHASHRPGPLRPNFFIGIRVTEPGIVAAAQNVQDTIVGGDPRLKDGVLPPTALHLTVCMLRVSSPKDADRVKAVLAANHRHFISLFVDSKLRIGGVRDFRGRVVYAAVELSPSLRLLNAALLLALHDAGVPTPGNHEGFTPHVTLVKLSRPMCRAMGDSAAVEPALYSQFTGMEFGEQTVDALHVCSMTAPKSLDDGFYVRLASLGLGLEALVPSLKPCLRARIEQLQELKVRSPAACSKLLRLVDTTDESGLQRLVSVLLQHSNASDGAMQWRFFSHDTGSESAAAHSLGCVYVVRGLPGSGKSRLAAKLRDHLTRTTGGHVKICSADEFFTAAHGDKDVDEATPTTAAAAASAQYGYDSVRIHQAHAYCLDVFMEAINAAVPAVVVDNTHVQRWHYALYVHLAALAGYRCRVVELQCRDAETARRLTERGKHAVPLPAVLRMLETWEPDARSVALSPVLAPGQDLDIEPVLSGPADVAQYPSVYYTAVFLSQKERRRLLNAYKPTHRDNVPEEMHCTLQFQPSQAQALALPLGTTVHLTVLGCANDGKNQAVAVRFESARMCSENSQAHITLSYANSSSAKMSNALLEGWTAAGKPLDNKGALVLSGTVACVLAYPPRDRLSLIADVDHLRRALGEPVGQRSPPPSVISHVPDRVAAAAAVETLYVYDFDGTLADTPGPVRGVELYQELTGSPWPHPSWLGEPMSLQAPLPIRPGPKMRSFREHRHRPRTQIVVLTGRQAETMREPVSEILRQFDVVPHRLICQPFASPVTADFKEAAMRELIASHPQLKKVVLYDDLPDNLVAFERLAKRFPKLEWQVIDAATHEAPAKRFKDPLRQFVNSYGSLASTDYHTAVAVVLNFLTGAWGAVLESAGGLHLDRPALHRLVIPFGSVVLGRNSDVDLCLVASDALGLSHMDWMKSFADHLEQCGLRRMHRGFSSRCPRVRFAVPLSARADVDVDVVFALLPAPAFDTLAAGSAAAAVPVAELLSAVPKADTVSHIALGGPLFAEEVLAVVESKCSVKVFAAVLEAVVLLMRAHHFKSNAFHLPRTFHYVKLLAQFVASASVDQLATVTKLFAAFVRHAATMGKTKWAKLCREFVPDVYFARLAEILGGTHAMLKRPQDVSLDAFVTLFRPEEPHLALLKDGFWARFQAVGKTCRPSADNLWKAGILLEARCGTFVRALLDRGFLFQPECRPSLDALRGQPVGQHVPLLSFAVHCSNTAADARHTLCQAFAPLLAELSDVFPAGQAVELVFPE